MAVYQIYPKKKRKMNIFGGRSVNTNIIIINVVAYLLFLILISLNILSWEQIAIKPANILQGNYLWTFLTSMFMHAPIFFHLFANMISLMFIGSLVEKILGPKRYLNFYLISGLFAGLFFVLASWLFFPNDLGTFAVGASGALFGLVGFLVLITPNLPVYAMFIPIPIKMKYAGPGLLVVLWLISIAGNIPIGNAAHFGGLIAGVAYGFYLKTKYKNKTKYISKVFS